MPTYTPPLSDIRFVLEELCDLASISHLPGYEEATPELVFAVLDEAGKLASEVLAPLNPLGDREGSKLVDGVVRTPPGWKEAYVQFIEGGWNGAVFDPADGGMGLPWLINVALQEMMNAANASFALCPMLTQGAVESLVAHADDAVKQRFLANMVSGTWTGTMNLTEAQAGSDLGAVRTRAEPKGDHYRIFGQKIFITYGDHDLTENIVHLVLARTPHAPPGVRGISLFAVPKRLIADDGTLGANNDVHCVSLEHKLGIHGSPTAVLSFGDQNGAVGYLVGEENRGLEYMFVMMNMERLGVGVQGLGIAERAYQRARSYARERVQGTPPGAAGSERRAIIHHPDVRRMLMTMKACNEAMRAVAYTTARALDESRHHPDDAVRRRQQTRTDLMTPVVKGWSTELAIELASLGVQVHGGMGYVEETGASQHLRDARITTIYEGTTGIQANDLVGRKIARDGGQGAHALIEEMKALDAVLAAAHDISSVRAALASGLDALDEVVRWIVDVFPRDPSAPAASAVLVLQLMGTVVGAYEMSRAMLAARRLLAAGEGDPMFLSAKIKTVEFYAEHIMPRATALVPVITRGAASVMALPAEQF